MEADQIIAEIARTTGLRLDKADPILTAAIINEVLLDRALIKLDRQVKFQADRVTAASTQAVLDAKKEAELLLGDAGTWIDVRIRTAAEEAAKFMLEEVRRETAQTKQARQTSVHIAWGIAILALIAFSGMSGVMLSYLL